MSLFLGNLSSHVRREELERVFRRFGRSNVQLKDGYGFVIFDVPYNAEKALRALRGKNICGEPVSITWANKQPRPFQRFARGTRTFEPNQGKNFTRGESYGMRQKGVNRRPDYKMVAKHLDSTSGLPYMVDPLEKEIVHHQERMVDQGREKGHDSKARLLDEGASIAPNLVDNDRWGEPASVPLNDNGVENGTDFDRYEPYHGFDKRDEEENQHMNGPYGSPTCGISQEKHWKEHSSEATLKQPNTPKPQQTCYGCGLTGHIIRYCPQADTSQQERFARFDHKRDDRIGFRGGGDVKSKSLRPSSYRRPKTSKDPMIVRQHRTDTVACGSGKSRKLVRRNGSFPGNRETSRSQPRRESRGRKRSRAEPGSPKKHHGKKLRKSTSSCKHSNSIASSSRSRSWSSKSVSGMSSYSRSSSLFRSRSVSSISTSSSTSAYSTSESSRSRSRSRSSSSSPSSLSLSISPGRPLPSSPSEAPTKATSASLKELLENVPSPQSKHLLVEQKQLMESDASSENLKRKGASVTVKDENTLLYLKVEDEMKKDSHGQLDDDRNHTISRIHYEVTNVGTNSLEQCIAGNPSSENLKDKRELLKSQPQKHLESPSGKANHEFPVYSQPNNSTRISSDEMYMVLKHHGLALPEESEKHLPIESFFGSARLWPWEIIYYRRLKKGPITTENYARRVAQNLEFGIVDKFVRSSSGWGECDHNNS
ncbi:serine/arginine-rich splicing factor 4-like [Macadamia integrifolia]|uniref:serine/arginine-rich splicing factor 4-like n=1 Tax=Macadamia integrifolia TaxID=60698 RepID=UPI001C529B49|nr:serine/arginine-rich splicing factor 4-like [Macadamia integrifolia]